MEQPASPSSLPLQQGENKPRIISLPFKGYLGYEIFGAGNLSLTPLGHLKSILVSGLGEGNHHSQLLTSLPGLEDWCRRLQLKCTIRSPARVLHMLYIPNEVCKGYFVQIQFLHDPAAAHAEHTNNFRCIVLHVGEFHVLHIPIICHRLWRHRLAVSSCWRT